MNSKIPRKKISRIYWMRIPKIPRNWKRIPKLHGIRTNSKWNGKQITRKWNLSPRWNQTMEIPRDPKQFQKFRKLKQIGLARIYQNLKYSKKSNESENSYLLFIRYNIGIPIVDVN